MKITTEHLMAAAKKSGQWLVSRQTPMGNYIGEVEPNENGIYSDTHDVGCYYKSTHFLQAVGETRAAAKMVNYLVEHFMSPEGDFFNSPENRTSGSYTPNYCQLYPNMWILRALIGMDWFALADKTLSFLKKYRDPKTGGFYNLVNPPTKVIDSNATGYGIFCQILGGDLESAIQSGDLILRMLKAQPETDRFYLRWTEEAGYETDFSNIPEKHLAYCVIDTKLPKQAYWCWAWPMNGLIQLYCKTQQEKYLKGAIEIFDFLSSCSDDSFHFTTAGKSGWGASLLYRITKDDRYLKKALDQMDFILGAQQSEGFMLGPPAKTYDEQPLRTTYDFTADFSSWLVAASMELADVL